MEYLYQVNLRHCRAFSKDVTNITKWKTNDLIITASLIHAFLLIAVIAVRLLIRKPSLQAIGCSDYLPATIS